MTTASYSDELPGLLVVGKTKEEIGRKLSNAVHELLKARGQHVIKVAVSDDDVPTDFGPISGFKVYTVVAAEAA